MVGAVLRGIPKAEAARTFGIGISTVKRYVGKAYKGEDLAPRRPPGKRRTLDEGSMKLLESDLKERPALTLGQRRTFLERVVGAQVSESRRSLERSSGLDGAEKKIGGCRRTRRVPEGRLEGDGRREGRKRVALCVPGDECSTNISLAPLYAWSPKEGKTGTLQGATQLEAERHAVGEHDTRRHRTVPGGGGWPPPAKSSRPTSSGC